LEGGTGRKEQEGCRRSGRGLGRRKNREAREEMVAGWMRE
jgi:hypothetical protein